MKETAAELQELINSYLTGLKQLDDNNASLKPAGKWSKKELIGHLIDSAQNNIRRFIVAQYETATITYNQDEWVSLNNYYQYNIEDLVNLWYALNRQVVSLLKNIPENRSGNICKSPEPRTIQWLASDYIKHLKHHMHQVLSFEPVTYP